MVIAIWEGVGSGVHEKGSREEAVRIKNVEGDINRRSGDAPISIKVLSHPRTAAECVQRGVKYENLTLPGATLFILLLQAPGER